MGRLKPREMFLYAFGNLGAGTFFAFNNFVLPLFLGRFTSNAIILGMLGNTRSFEGAIIQPVVGGASDRIWTPAGRRRPFMLAGLPLSALLLFVTPHFSALPVLIVCIFLFTLLFNVALDPYIALMPDITPPEQRNMVQGLVTALNYVGQVGALLAIFLLSKGTPDGHIPDLAFAVVAAVMLGTFGVSIFGTRERRHMAHVTQKLAFGRYLRSLLSRRQAMIYLICVAAFNFGLNAIQPYLTRFSVEVLHTDEGVALLLAAFSLGTALLAAFPMGLLANRMGTRTVLGIGLGLLAVAGGMGIVIETVPQTLLALFFAGAGTAAVAVTAYPMLFQLVPPSETGVFAGIKTTFESIAIPASTLVTGSLINAFGYRSIFYAFIGGILVAMAGLAFVRIPQQRASEISSLAIAEAA